MLKRSSSGLTLCGAAILLVVPAVASAQSGTSAGLADESHAVAAPNASAVRTNESITIDAELSEGAWASAPVITQFTQTDPNEGQPVSQRTEVRILYDEDAIYVGAMLHDDGEVRSRLARRDNHGDSDVFAVVFDSYHDHQTAFRFATNPSGVMRDELLSSGANDDSWDPVWDLETERTATGWRVEMRIPFSQLRFSREAEQTWGIQLERSILRNQESAQFAFTPKLERSGVQRYGHLSGIEGIRPGRRVELLPYVAARAEYIDVDAPAEIAFENPYRSGSDYFSNAGLDLKFRLTSNVTLDATVNPDFGQVEVDPAVINLTAFETRFEERRPFFVEGAEIFRFGQGGPAGSTGRPAEVVYSRRIGRSPQGSVPELALFSDAPTATTILGAAKVTAKLANGISVGILEAVTNRETGRFTTSSGALEEVEVEPLANYFIGRIRRDSSDGTTRFGAIASTVHRNLSDRALEGRLHSAAYTAGVDLVHEWDDGVWRLNSSLSPSLVVGSNAALIRTQQTSTRYFNRPDAEHLSVDSTATRLTGYYAMAELNKAAGTFTGRIGLGATSPGYEVNDIGFQSYADRLIVETHFQYNETRPGKTFRSWTFGGGPDNIWNYEGQHVLSNVNLVSQITFLNYWGVGLRFEWIPETYDDRLTRGGPLARSPEGLLGRINFNSDTRRNVTYRGTINVSQDDGDSWAQSISGGIDLRPRENWQISIGPNWTRGHTSAQYVTSIADSRAVNTFGRRYLFGGLDQTTLGIDTRVNVTFSPTLSFELYAQPFLSAGDYVDLKELAQPGTYEFRTYGEEIGTVTPQSDGSSRIDPVGDDTSRSFVVEDLDFNFRSVLGNAVLRWEWRAGSTMYLVWQQSREENITGLGEDEIGQVDFGPEARALFGIKPDNVFAIKVNYWLNP